MKHKLLILTTIMFIKFNHTFYKYYFYKYFFKLRLNETKDL